MTWKVRLAWAVPILVLALAAGTVRVRQPIGVGILYPANFEPLKKAVDQYLSEADSIPLGGRVVALMAPHSSYPASGAIAAAAFKTIQKGDYDRVIVLSPAIKSEFRGCSIPDVEAFRTPMGDIPIDGKAVRRATMSSIIALRSVVYRASAYLDPDVNRVPMHESETAIETALPFLQAQLGKFRMVPVLVGQFKGIRGGVDQGAINDVVKALKPIVDEKTLIVVCSDLTGYGTSHNFTPFKDNVLTHIGELDMQAVHFIEALDYKGFMKYLETSKNPISGAMCLTIMMRLLPANVHGVLLSYDVSGHKTGNLDASVSFASMAFVDVSASAALPASLSTEAPQEPAAPAKPAQAKANPTGGTAVKDAEDVKHGDNGGNVSK